MTEFDYPLAWPHELFAWEARRILDLTGDHSWRSYVEALLDEAFDGIDAEEFLGSQFPAANPLNPEAAPAELVDWLRSTANSSSALRKYVRPVYWAERQGGVEAATPVLQVNSLAEDWFETVADLASNGYFPDILPVGCVDDDSSWTSPEEVSAAIFRATRLRFVWPESPIEAQKLDLGTVFTLVEYFHDQAQRPRSYRMHYFAECGRDYEKFNPKSGGAVYRWRVNQILDAHGVALRLASRGPERGQLVHAFGGELDTMLSEELDSRSQNPKDEVSDAIRMFRARGATLTNKRAALALLAGALEPQRRRLEKLVAKPDVDGIFNIANKYNIRHRGNQVDEQREEYLEWSFWIFLAMIKLWDAIESKSITDAAAQN